MCLIVIKKPQYRGGQGSTCAVVQYGDLHMLNLLIVSLYIFLYQRSDLRMLLLKYPM
jgi:hypothetical protein